MQFFQDGPRLRPVCFQVEADAEPGLLPRLIAPFARRDLCPDRVRAQRHGASLLTELAMDAMPAEMVHLVEGNLRQVVGVRRVTVELRSLRAVA